MNESFKLNYLETAIKQFEYYKMLGEKTFSQLSEKELFWEYNSSSNSVAIVVKHIVGNMLSRWTNFLSEDGEKPWRNRDQEFENTYQTKEELLKAWEKGWTCLFESIKSLKNSDFNRLIYIRNQGHTVQEAITRQLCHYAYHVGQLVYLGKMIKGSKWKSLSVPKNESIIYNKEKFNKDKERKHFTEDL
jgi:hypothetical protein